MVVTGNASHNRNRSAENKQFPCPNRKDILKSKLLADAESTRREDILFVDSKDKALLSKNEKMEGFSSTMCFVS